jgi:DNA-binding MarR family transcriptional regulator
MVSVKDVPESERHVAVLLGRLFEQTREPLLTEDWGGLRPSHFRVLEHVPPDGVSVTDLADRVGMTKQGCGQFVTFLVDTGHLVTEPAAADRRVRLVRRTARGNDDVRAVSARLGEVERDWAERVGPRRYRAFREVLEELAFPT